MWSVFLVALNFRFHDSLLTLFSDTRSTKPGIALDIDDTLCKTNEHWVAVMQKAFGNPEDLSPSDFCKKYPLLEPMPSYWQSSQVKDWILWAREDVDFSVMAYRFSPRSRGHRRLE